MDNHITAAVEFKLKGPGWADTVFCLCGESFTLKPISYTTDAVGDLTRFALGIATGSDYQTTSFDQEPAEYRLVAHSMYDTATEKGPVQISVYEFPDMRQAPLTDGHLLFVGSCDALDFARAVLKTAKIALQFYKEDKWGTLHAPPTAALRALEAALTPD